MNDLRLARRGVARNLLKRPVQLWPLEAHEHVGACHHGLHMRRHPLDRRRCIERMVSREDRAFADGCEYARAEQFGQLHALAPGILRAIASTEQQHGLAAFEQQRGNALDLRLACSGRRRRRKSRELGDTHGHRELLFLKACIQAHVRGAVRQRHARLPGADHPFHDGIRRAGLIVHFVKCRSSAPWSFVVWIQSIQGRRFSTATGPVAPSTSMGTRSHQALKMPMSRASVRRYCAGTGHHLVRRLSVTMRDRDCVIFIEAQQHLRIAVAQIVHEAVMQPPVTCSRVQGDVLDAQPLEHFSGHIARKREWRPTPFRDFDCFVVHG